MPVVRYSAWIACLSLSIGCNQAFGVDDLRFDGIPGQTSAGGSAGGSAVGGQGGMVGLGGAGGAGGDAGGHGGAGGSRPPVDCGGMFGPPELLLETAFIGSPSISGDELTVYYVVESNKRVMRATRSRATGPFGTPVEVESLSDACDDHPKPLVGFDLSPDESVAFVACGDSQAADAVTRILSLRGGQWVVGESLVDTGTSPSVSADGLAVYTTTTNGPLVMTRPSIDDAFGAAVPVSGLDGTPLATASPSPDGRALFGYLVVNGAAALATATRASPAAPFDAPVDLGIPFAFSASPDMSVDCRRLYFIGAGDQSPNGIYVIER
jgi:hypothetical protein